MSYINSDNKNNKLLKAVRSLYPDKRIVNVYYRDIKELSYSQYILYFFFNSKIYSLYVCNKYVQIPVYRTLQEDLIYNLYLPLSNPLEALSYPQRLSKGYYSYGMEEDYLSYIIFSLEASRLVTFKKDIENRMFNRDNKNHSFLNKLYRCITGKSSYE